MARTKGPAYKLKSAEYGGPMRRNYGIASPLHREPSSDHKHPHPKVKVTTVMSADGNKKSETRNGITTKWKKNAAYNIGDGSPSNQSRPPWIPDDE